MLHETEEQMVARIEAEERARMEFEDIEQAHAAGLGSVRPVDARVRGGGRRARAPRRAGPALVALIRPSSLVQLLEGRQHQHVGDEDAAEQALGA